MVARACRIPARSSATKTARSRRPGAGGFGNVRRVRIRDVTTRPESFTGQSGWGALANRLFASGDSQASLISSFASNWARRSPEEARAWATSLTEEVENREMASYSSTMISAEELVGEEWAEWYQLTPAQRWTETSRLWHLPRARRFP